MKNLMKRGVAMLIALVLCVSFIPAAGISVSAAEVSYVYDGKYIYNWGTRGETATFLSPNAEAFYKENASYDELSSYSGGTGRSDAPSSDLYKTLQNLMRSAHTYTTSYDGTKSLYKYTDCQGGGGKISSFYSGKDIGPSWDGNWNREHTWPNSKGLGGSDENDIMMLRPTSTSENSSRGNTAYGQSSGYYNPNSESGGKYDLRGDVARIFLYVYVRWGNVNGNGTNGTWGMSGVMESVEVMLDWMEADPVDTWELGRNDSVEAITGTRNVFVDYPELAFLLFGEEIPDDMVTPSGEGKGCDHNNYDTGVTFVATCTEKGYILYTCQTAGCGATRKTDFTAPKGHNYVSDVCTVCGSAKPITPAKPTFVTELSVGTAYKLGFFSTDKDREYYFSGTMSGYYGATDTAYANGVDVYVEATSGGYYMYFVNSSGQKQYINLVLSGTHYNFTYSSSATSVFVWDSAKSALSTTVSGETCHIGTYGTHVTMGVLRSSLAKDTDYIARMYTFEGSGETPDDSCNHKYSEVVTAPTCTKDGFTTYTCSLCGDTYKGNTVVSKGHTYVNNKCTACGAVKNTSEAQVIISFKDAANRTVFNEKQQVWTQNGITVTNNKASASSNVADYTNPVRFYQSSEVIIEYKGITKIEINCSGLESKYVNSWMNAPTGVTATNNNGVITLVFATPVDSVTYKALTTQARAYEITVYAESEAPEACNHTNTTVEGAVAPTCTADGHTGKTVCVDCGEVTDEGQAIRATGHKWVDADCDTPKTCSVCEATDGDALGHDWIDATTEAPKTCDRCGLTEGDKLPGETPDDSENPDDSEAPDENNTSDGEENAEKDHTQCEASFFEKLINAITNFLARLFGKEEKCVCGEILN